MRLIVITIAIVLTYSQCSGGFFNAKADQQNTTSTGSDAVNVPYTLVWEENFEGDQLNREHWNFELGDGCDLGICGWGNNELQYYTDTNHKVADGMLTITVTHDDGYQSTRMTTKGKKTFQYGKFEARMKLPQGAGIWPAFWMLGSDIQSVGWPACGEIDIMEYVGRMPGIVHHSLHTPSSHGQTINTKAVAVSGLEDEFHVYAVTWSRQMMQFYIDDTLTYTYASEKQQPDEWPFNKPFYLLLNVAVGGSFGGEVTNNAIFPQSFVIDYIKVYQQLP